jgi:hypothetical protein
MHHATSRKVLGSIPDEVNEFSNWPNPSGRRKTLGSTEPLIEMNTRNIPESKGQPARKVDSLTAICKYAILDISPQ